MSDYRDIWTHDHGADGLRDDKFAVYKYDDRHDEPSDTIDIYLKEDRIGTTGEFIFTLRPESDEAAWYALSLYAKSVEHRAPQLALDIRTKLRRIKVHQDFNHD